MSADVVEWEGVIELRYARAAAVAISIYFRRVVLARLHYYFLSRVRTPDAREKQEFNFTSCDGD
jgi:hypothetical protein